MRNIKFRAITSEYKRWVKGDLTSDCDNDDMYIFPDEEEYRVKVKPRTIGQYIGRDDKNGTEIYEGDIIRWYNSEKNICLCGKIIWSDYQLGFVVQLDGFCCDILISSEIEVIGNIYDNPNLLK